MTLRYTHQCTLAEARRCIGVNPSETSVVEISGRAPLHRSTTEAYLGASSRGGCRALQLYSALSSSTALQRSTLYTSSTPSLSAQGLPCTSSEGPRGPHRPRRESRTARQRPRACGVSALFAQTVEGAGEAGRVRRRGAGARGARCGCAARPASQAGLQRDNIKKKNLDFPRFAPACWELGPGNARRATLRREEREARGQKGREESAPSHRGR